MVVGLAVIVTSMMVLFQLFLRGIPTVVANVIGVFAVSVGLFQYWFTRQRPVLRRLAYGDTLSRTTVNAEGITDYTEGSGAVFLPWEKVALVRTFKGLTWFVSREEPSFPSMVIPLKEFGDRRQSLETFIKQHLPEAKLS